MRNPAFRSAAVLDSRFCGNDETIAKPTPISALAVRHQDIIVFSRLSLVRIQPKWLSALTLTSNLLGPAAVADWLMF
jgi:hypothetical protein